MRDNFGNYWVGVGFDIEDESAAAVESFLSRASITDPTQVAAVTALAIAAAQHGWWEKCDLVYPFVGGNATAHAQNLKSANFTITWNGAVTHNANGVTGTGAANVYGDTNYMPDGSGQMLQNSTHCGFYRRTLGNEAAYCGCTESGKELKAGRLVSPLETAIVVAVNDANSTEGGLSTSLAFSIIVRNDSARKHIFTGGVDKSISRVSSGLPSAPKTLFILCNNNNGTPANFSSANLAGFTAGIGMTLAEYVTMAADWQTFQTALGRQV